MTCATSSSFLLTSGRCPLVGCGMGMWQCHGHCEMLWEKFVSGTRNFFQVPHAALVGNTRELSTYLLLCLGYDLLWVKTKLSWLFADCKRCCVLGNMRLQTEEVGEMGHFFVPLSVYSWMYSKLSWTQPCAACSDFEVGSSCRVGCTLNGGLD